jgi:shikimate kinase
MDQMRSIFLVGFMGAGKSSIGAAVAARRGSRFVDLDQVISTRLGAPIVDVFADRGEPTFRAAEHDELARAVLLEEVVVATGGGAFCNPVNRDLIHRSGAVSVFLDLPWSKLAERLAADNSDRPMYDDADQARRLFEERLPEYRRAMVRVPLDGSESSAEAAERVVDALREAPCAT